MRIYFYVQVLLWVAIPLFFVFYFYGHDAFEFSSIMSSSFIVLGPIQFLPTLFFQFNEKLKTRLLMTYLNMSYIVLIAWILIVNILDDMPFGFVLILTLLLFSMSIFYLYVLYDLWKKTSK
jgi:hypothetical protein